MNVIADLPSVSIWNATEPGRPYPSLAADLEVDVAIVGAGIVGLTAAHLLKAAGRTVAVLEARRVAAQVTGGSTAKITSQHGAVYSDLIGRHGEAAARQYGQANEAAIRTIAATAERLGVDCDLETTASYVFTRSPDGVESLCAEADAAASLGLPASFVDTVPVGVSALGAVRFDRQAQFHPRKYLLAMADAIKGEGSHVFEDTRAIDVDDSPCVVRTALGEVQAGAVIIATNLPFLGRLPLDDRGLRLDGRSALRRPSDPVVPAYICRDGLQRVGHHERHRGGRDSGCPGARTRASLRSALRFDPSRRDWGETLSA